jgi:hypothetical protein
MAVGRSAVAEIFFDFCAQFLAGALEIAGDTGFVFTEEAADFGESFFAGVVKLETPAILMVESSKADGKGIQETPEVETAIGIERRGDDVRGGQRLFGAVVALEGRQAAGLAESIDVALREDSAQPGFEGTAAVEIAEKRGFAAFAIGKAVEFGKERIGEVGARSAVASNSSGGGAKVRTIGADEILPGRFRTIHAGASEDEIIEMEGFQIFFEGKLADGAVGETATDAALDGGLKLVAGDSPFGGA